MNYLVELNMFDDWVETEDISANAVLLWRTLMAVANRSGWKEEFTVCLSTLESRTKLHKATICRVRDELRDAGLLSYESRGGRSSAVYRLHSFALRYATQSENRSGFELQGATQNGCPAEFDSQIALHTATQNDNQSGVELHSATQGATINKLNISLSKDKTDSKSSKKRKEKSCAKKEPTHEAGAEVSSLGYALREGGRQSQNFDLSFVDDPVWEEILRSWLEYKRSRNQGYKSELSVKKFLTMLKSYASDNVQTAQQIIDRSIANGWAGIFELPATGNPRGQPPNRPATGQRIGQIKQPEDEVRRQQLIDKFGKKKP